jgi:hypothetical protein
MGPNAFISWSNVTNPPTIPTNTNQLTDGAGLGTTATWTGVSDKPELVLANGVTTLGSNFVYTGIVDADKLTSGSFISKGSYLQAAVSAGATTLILLTTEDFPSNGSGWILDSVNDKDVFTWTGKTNTTLTGCSGVLEHTIGCAVIPKLPGMVFDSKAQELRIYGYNTPPQSITETDLLFTCGIKQFGDEGADADTAIMRVGNTTFSRGVSAYFEAKASGVFNGTSYDIGEVVRIQNYSTYSNSSFTCGLRVLHHTPYYIPPDGDGGGDYWQCDPKAEGIVSQGSRYGVRGIGGSAVASSSYGTAGVYGYGWGSSGLGVQGEGTHTGVYGVSLNGTGVKGYGGTRDFYATGPGTNYASFTGAHDALLAKNTCLEVGDIVVDSTVIYKSSISSTITSISLTSVCKQRNIVGVFTGSRFPLDQNDVPTALKVRDQDADIPDYDYLEETFDVCLVNSIGEGQINVCKDGGNIEAGDYICSSSRPGKGMKQDDDVLHNYTVAKAREDCVWQEGEDDIRMIACTYHCG